MDPEKLGLGIQALVSVSLGQHSTKTIQPFEHAVKSIPYIMVGYPRHRLIGIDWILRHSSMKLSG